MNYKDDKQAYKVVTNNHNYYSIIPAYQDNFPLWTSTCAYGTIFECVNYIRAKIATDERELANHSTTIGFSPSALPPTIVKLHQARMLGPICLTPAARVF